MEVAEGGRDQLCRGRGGMGGEQEAVLELSIWSLMKGIICTSKNILHLYIYLANIVDSSCGYIIYIYNYIYILYVRVFTQKCKSGTV